MPDDHDVVPRSRAVYTSNRTLLKQGVRTLLPFALFMNWVAQRQ